MNVTRDWLAAITLFGILTILTLVTIVYAKEAEQEAREVRTELRELNVSGQIRCVVEVLSIQDQGDKVVVFDQCINDETEGVRP